MRMCRVCVFVCVFRYITQIFDELEELCQITSIIIGIYIFKTIEKLHYIFFKANRIFQVRLSSYLRRIN